MNHDVPSSSHSSEEAVDYPKPPSLHWALVMLFHMLTFGIFGFVWMFRQAAWVRRIDPTSNAVFILAASFALSVILMFGGDEAPMELIRGLAFLGGTLAYIWALFSMRRVIEEQFELSLSGMMTFFFNFLYFQYHMTRIAKGEYKHTPRRQSLMY